MGDMNGKVIVITGGNTGIGKEAAVALAAGGAQVVITSRNEERGRTARQEIAERSGNESVDVMSLDLASFRSIRSFATDVLDRFDHLDVLVNNAGLILHRRAETQEGFEETFGVNHLGHFLLTDQLLERLRASAPSRSWWCRRVRTKAPDVDSTSTTSRPSTSTSGWTRQQVEAGEHLLHWELRGGSTERASP
jgi:NAD(P)-dependent dehydrogenase (short-subunit alcohol dehydrogenase family)